MLEFQSVVQSTLLTKRSIEQISRIAGRLTMLEHRNRFPGHFVPTAVTKYGYAKRSKKYMIRKARRQGHQNPLVFTGGLRTAIMANAKVTATKDRATLRTKGNTGHQLQPQYRKELEAITTDEHRQMVDLYERTFVVLASSGKFKKRASRDSSGRFVRSSEPQG